MAGQADLLVTGDADLLALAAEFSCPIVTAANFLKMLETIVTSNITYDIVAKLLNLYNVSIQKIREGLLRDACCSVRIRIRNTQGKRSSIATGSSR